MSAEPDNKDIKEVNEEGKEEEKEQIKEESDNQNLSEIEEKYVNPGLLNDDPEESLKMEKLAIEAKPYFSSTMLPRSLYLQNTVLPLVYEALTQVEKIRPKDPIEFFAVYLLDKNKKDI